MNAPDKALAHYSAQADLAALQHEIARLRGEHLTPRRSCHLIRAELGQADVWIEFEAVPDEGDGWDSEHFDAYIDITGVFINGAIIPAHPFTGDQIRAWEQTAADWMKTEAAAQAEDVAQMRAGGLL